MVRVEESHGVLVKKYGLRLFKRHTMFSDIGPPLVVIPFKAQVANMYSVRNMLEKSMPD